MIKKDNYNFQNHPTENNMNMGTQTARLYGKLNIGVKKEPDPDVLILDGNVNGLSDLINLIKPNGEIQVMDGNS